MGSKVSPLHGVVDANQWDTKRLLGRLVIVLHAAFLESGFIVARRHSGDPSSTCRLATEVGATASTLSLEYTAPPLLPRHDMDAAALRVCTNGRHVIFYLQLQVCPVRIRTYWVCLDALSVAPLLSGGLDDTGSKLLGSDGSRTATLWRSVTDGFCHRILSDICREHGVVPGRAPRAPTLTSLPGDAMVAILERLADGKDLASVESTCTELRRFVADRDRQLWLPRYKALPGNTLWWSLLCDIDSDDDLPATSWKEMFMWATRQREHRLVLPTPSPIRSSPWYSFFNGRADDDGEEADSFELPVDAAACFGEIMTETETEGDGGKNSRIPQVAAMAMVRRRRQAATRSSRVVAPALASALSTPRLLGTDGSTGERSSLLGLFTSAASSCDVQKHLPLNGIRNCVCCVHRAEELTKGNLLICTP